ncbi:MAG: hypothetical protein IPG79_03355 [Saprospiraceae bacterium]|nr:hypothetical protein [Saprospiraceae bacterium]
MKRYLIFISIFFLWLASCTPKAFISYQRTGEVESVAGDKSTITLSATGFASDGNTAAGYAERNAIENMLFKGIPGSVLENAMISDENKARSNHGMVLDKLDHGRGIMPYVIDAYTENSIKQNREYL